MALFLLGGLLMLMSSQVLASCPDKEVMSNVNIPQLMGTWYYIKHTDVNFQGFDEICNHNVLRQHDDNSFYDLHMYTNKTTGEEMRFRGIINRASPNATDGKFYGLFNISSLPIAYYVLHTDYDNFVVVSLCWQSLNGEGDLEMTVIHSRKRSLDSASLAEAERVLPTGVYKFVNQTGCPEHDHTHHEHNHHNHRHDHGHDGHNHTHREHNHTHHERNHTHHEHNHTHSGHDHAHEGHSRHGHDHSRHSPEHSHHDNDHSHDRLHHTHQEHGNSHHDSSHPNDSHHHSHHSSHHDSSEETHGSSSHEHDHSRHRHGHDHHH